MEKLYISSVEQHANFSAGYSCWKDTSSIFIGVKENITSLFDNRFKHPEDFMGLSDFDLGIEEEFVLQFLAHDKIALSGTPWCGLELTNWGEKIGRIVTVVMKVPLYDLQDNIVGVFGQCMPVKNEYLLNMVKTLNISRNKHQISNKDRPFFEIIHEDPLLTGRERETLFYTIHGKSAKEIAAILRLSSRTIEYYLENIKFKFHCRTKSELIAKAMQHGFLDKIPQSILNAKQ